MSIQKQVIDKNRGLLSVRRVDASEPGSEILKKKMAACGVTMVVVARRSLGQRQVASRCVSQVRLNPRYINYPGTSRKFWWKFMARLIAISTKSPVQFFQTKQKKNGRKNSAKKPSLISLQLQKKKRKKETDFFLLTFFWFSDSRISQWTRRWQCERCAVNQSDTLQNLTCHSVMRTVNFMNYQAQWQVENEHILAR